MLFEATADTIELIRQVCVNVPKLVVWMAVTLHFGPEYSSPLIQQLNRKFEITCFDCTGSSIRCK
jgi:hypothetical protein